jgi:hypothetical protein
MAGGSGSGGSGAAPVPAPRVVVRTLHQPDSLFTLEWLKWQVRTIEFGNVILLLTVVYITISFRDTLLLQSRQNDEQLAEQRSITEALVLASARVANLSAVVESFKQQSLAATALLTARSSQATGNVTRLRDAALTSYTSQLQASSQSFTSFMADYGNTSTRITSVNAFLVGAQLGNTTAFQSAVSAQRGAYTFSSPAGSSSRR